jgi:pilin isopeptide linkage protein
MRSVRFYKKAVCLGAALLLLVGLSPTRAFAAEPVTVSLEIENYIDGDVPKEDVPFTFVLKPEDDAEPLPEALTTTVHGEGTAEFENITYTSKGVYEYTIYQNSDKQEGYTYDDSVYYVKVEVSSDARGKLYTTVTTHKQNEKQKARSFEFVNTYTEPDTPDTPETPVTPETPETSVTPETPVTAETTPTQNVTTETKTVAQTAKTTQNSSPRTGDLLNQNLWIGLVCVSGIVLVCAIIIRLRRKNYLYRDRK